MKNYKMRVWDKQEKCFFVTNHARDGKGECKELLFSQEGEIYLRQSIDGDIKLTHEKNLEMVDRFVRDWYVGIRDNNEKKYFINDIVKFTTKGKSGNVPTYSYGVLIWDGDCLAIGSGPINDYTAVDPISERELREAENVGNIYQDAKIIMGDLTGHL